MCMDAVYLNDLDDVWGCFRRLDSQSVLSKLQFVHQDKKKTVMIFQPGGFINGT